MPKNIAILLFLLLALPVSGFMAWAMPPYFNVDESNHVMRAETVLRGHVFGSREPDGSSGGFIDEGLLELLSHYWSTLSEPGRVMSAATMADGETVPWSGRTRFVHIPNTAIYPPTLYLPTMAGLWIGKVLDFGVADSIRLARFANIAACLLLFVTALRLAAFGHGPLVAVALWPLCLAQYAACGQDGLLIALSAVYAALMTRAIARQGRSTAAEFIGLALVSLLLSMSRPANLALLLPLLMVMPGRLGRVPGWAMLLPALLMPVAWALHAVLFVQVMQVHGDVVPDLGAQVLHLLSHPLAFPAALVDTLFQWGWPFTIGMLGWIGWSQVNIILPDALYPFYLWVFGLVLAFSAVTPGNQPGWRVKTGMALGLVGTVLAIFLLQYLTFSAVGAGQVDGVQGRYFAPLALLLGLLVPALGDRLPARLHPRFATLTLVLLSFTGILTAVALPHAVTMRVYVTAG
ncbi:DUF2142 domain-containing protein [Niveispirillum lacus]|nr:DUF2142 domain-containing protein [Niveispirillum lacus]